MGVISWRPRHSGPQRPDGRRQKNAVKTAANHLHRRQNSQSREPSNHLLRTGMSTSSGDELKLGHFHCHNRLCMITGKSITVDELHHVIDHTAPVVAQQRAVNDLVQGRKRSATVGARLSPHRLHSDLLDLTTGTSITLSMHCNWKSPWLTGPRKSAPGQEPHGICRCTPTGM